MPEGISGISLKIKLFDLHSKWNFLMEIKHSKMLISMKIDYWDQINKKLTSTNNKKKTIVFNNEIFVSII